MTEPSIHAGVATATNANNRRRRLLINPAAQKRFVMSISVPTLLMLLAVSAWAWWLENVAVGDVATTGESDTLTGFLPFGAGIFFAVLLFAGTVVVQSLRVSHRVEGAAYRMIKAMQRVRTGDVGFTVTLRKKDHLQEVAAELNELIAWIRTQLPAPTAAANAAPDQTLTTAAPPAALAQQGR